MSGLARGARGDALIVLTTLLWVVFRDLTTGIMVGFALAGLVFIKRMSDATELHAGEYEATGGGQRGDLLVYKLRGPFFFGSAAQIGGVLDRIADRPQIFAIDFTEVPMIDSSGARSFEVLARKLHRKGGQLCIVGAVPKVRRVLQAQGLEAPHAHYLPDLSAVEAMISPAST